MTNLLKTASIILLSFSLIACDGFDFDSDSGVSSSDESFSRSELAFNVLYSSLLLNDSGFSSNRDGFVAFFKSSSELEEIELRSNDDDDALVGSYPWTIVNGDLQVTYPNGVTCTTEKNSQTGSQYTASSNCDGGEPNNDRIRNTLNKPVSFDEDDLSSNSVIIEAQDNDTDQRIEFFSNGIFEIRDLDDNGDEVASSTQSGTYGDAEDYNNIVRLDNPESDEYSLLMLLTGSLSTGTMLHLRYTATTDELNEVIIYDIDSVNRWDVDSLYNNIDIDE